jgi:hypothetical protein
MLRFNVSTQMPLKKHRIIAVSPAYAWRTRVITCTFPYLLLIWPGDLQRNSGDS